MPGLEFKVCAEIFQIADIFNYLRWYRVPVSELVQTCKHSGSAVTGYDTCTRLGSANLYFKIILLMPAKTETPFNPNLFLTFGLSY
jgi:hypothetical protein